MMAQPVPTAVAPELATILLDQPTGLGFRQVTMIMMLQVVRIVHQRAREVITRDGGTQVVAIIGMHIDHHLVRTMEKKQE